MKTIHRLTLTFLLSCSWQASAATVATQNLKGWVLPDGSGYAHEIFQAVVNESELDLELSIQPLTRAIKNFQDKKVDCFLGGDQQIFRDLVGIDVLSSELFLRNNFVISTLKTHPMISSVDQLEGFTIGLERGIDINILKDDFSKVEVREGLFANQLEMLKLGRIRAILGYYPDHKDIFDQLHFDPKFVQYSYSDRLNCVVSESNKTLIERFNQGLKGIKQKGIYQQIYKKYFGDLNLLQQD